MKNIKITHIKFVTMVLAFGSFFTLFAQHETHASKTTGDSTKKSIPREVHAQMGKLHTMIFYHSPAVRGRTIWGGLVPYGEVWVTGAHNATLWEFNEAIEINNTKVEAGKYAIFTIPGKEKWIFILNKKWKQHLADEYDTKEDVLRVEVKPETVLNAQERLSYTLEQQSKFKGVLSIQWEHVRLTIPFQVK
ncbi:MAG: DUF2911 domain-containing protein [Flammeovirgaceae bacterium]